MPCCWDSDMHSDMLCDPLRGDPWLEWINHPGRLLTGAPAHSVDPDDPPD
jgi:hypothetical protein